jgi:cellulose synthase/poly-beta-1,6-N-acetylglucosamine synthase-like glycosyltransferase
MAIIFFKNGRIDRLDAESLDELPKVTIIIPAYNEAEYLEQKILNTISLNYDSGKKNIIVITDGSNDHSKSVVKQFSNVTYMHNDERRGKFAAMKRAIDCVTTPITIFTDANAILNDDAILNMVRHYKDINVGAVAGEKRVAQDPSVISSASCESLYWKYESFLKKLDAEFNSVIGAAGELFSIRTSLFEDIGDNIVLDDFMLTLKINLKGFKTEYEPNSFAVESASANIVEEHERKVRISAGGYQSIILLMKDKNLFRYPKLVFQLLSRRVMRWMITPMLLPVILIANLILVNIESPEYIVLLLVQSLFYLFAFFGFRSVNKKGVSKFFKIPFYFTFMHISALLGMVRFFKGSQSVTWRKVRRLN